METKEMITIQVYKGSGELTPVDVERGTTVRQVINQMGLSTKNQEVRVNAEPVQDLDQTLIMDPETIITLIPNVEGGR